MDLRVTLSRTRLVALALATLGARELFAQPAPPPRSLSPLRIQPEFILQVPARHRFLDVAFGVALEPQPQPQAVVDLGPLVGEVTGFLRAHGIPLHQDPQLAGSEGIVFSAAWSVADQLPALQFHIGDTGPYDAFYDSDDRAFRWSLTLPIEKTSHFALNLGGGENSEFGSWGIVGVQWRHRRRPLAIGVGVAVAPSNAHGPVGVICQMRMRLD